MSVEKTSWDEQQNCLLVLARIDSLHLKRLGPPGFTGS